MGLPCFKARARRAGIRIFEKVRVIGHSLSSESTGAFPICGNSLRFSKGPRQGARAAEPTRVLVRSVSAEAKALDDLTLKGWTLSASARLNHKLIGGHECPGLYHEACRVFIKSWQRVRIGVDQARRPGGL